MKNDNTNRKIINKYQDDKTGTSITQIFNNETLRNEGGKNYYESYLLINKGNASFAVKTLVKQEDLKSFQNSQDSRLPRNKIVPITFLLKADSKKYNEKDNGFITEFNNINSNIYSDISKNEQLIESFSGIGGLKIDVKDLNFTDQDFTIYDSKYPKIPLKITNPKIEGYNNVISGINEGKLSENNLITLDLNLYGKENITNNSNYAINFIYDKDNNLKPVFKLKKEKNKEQNNNSTQEILLTQQNQENSKNKDKEVSNEDEYDLFKFNDPKKEKAFLEKLNDKKALTIKGSELTRLEPNDAIKPAPSNEKVNSPNPIISPTGLHPIGGSRSILNSNVTRDAVRGGITAGLLFCPFGPILALAFLFFTRNKDKADVSQEDLSSFIDSLTRDINSLRNNDSTLKKAFEEISNEMKKIGKTLTEKEKKELEEGIENVTRNKKEQEEQSNNMKQKIGDMDKQIKILKQQNNLDNLNPLQQNQQGGGTQSSANNNRVNKNILFTKSNENSNSNQKNSNSNQI